MMGRSPGSQAGAGWEVRPQRLPHGWGVIQIKLFPTQHGSGYFLGRRWRTGLSVRCMVAPQLAGSAGLSWEAVASVQQRGSSCLLTVLSTQCLAGFWPSLQQQHNLPVTQEAVFALLLPKTTVPWRAACN